VLVLILWFCCPWVEEGKFSRTWITSKSTGWCIVGLKRFIDNDTLQDQSRVISSNHQIDWFRDCDWEIMHPSIMTFHIIPTITYTHEYTRVITKITYRFMSLIRCKWFRCLRQIEFLRSAYFLSDYLCSLKNLCCREANDSSVDESKIIRKRKPVRCALSSLIC